MTFAGLSMHVASTGSANAGSARTITLIARYGRASSRTDDVAPEGAVGR